MRWKCCLVIHKEVLASSRDIRTLGRCETEQALRYSRSTGMIGRKAGDDSKERSEVRFLHSFLGTMLWRSTNSLSKWKVSLFISGALKYLPVLPNAHKPCSNQNGSSLFFFALHTGIPQKTYFGKVLWGKKKQNKNEHHWWDPTLAFNPRKNPRLPVSWWRCPLLHPSTEPYGVCSPWGCSPQS